MKSSLLISMMLMIAIVMSMLSACTKDKDGDEVNEAEEFNFSCLISFPENGMELMRGDTIPIQVSGNNPLGSIKEILYYVDNIRLESIDSLAYEYLWISKDESLGNHKISIRCVYNNGGEISDAIDVIIVDGPTAKFTAHAVEGEVPFIVQFWSQSTNNPKSYIWHFGDGDTSTLQNPSHIYYNAGEFNVSLTVTNEYGSDSLCKLGLIIVHDSVSYPFTDPRDGQTYETIKIGTQFWFAENLNFQTANSVWYDNDPVNGELYGSLYVWEDASLACPDGWHLPTDDEWKILEMELGMSEYDADRLFWRGTDQGAQLKATDGWYNSGNGTNTSGFTAMPGGIRGSNGQYIDIGESGLFWSSTPTPLSNYAAMRRILTWDKDRIYYNGEHKTVSISVRCLKD